MWPGRPAAWSRISLARRRIFAIGEQHGRIEIALHGPVVADDLQAVVEPDSPVDADHVAAGLGQERQQRRVAGGEVDHRHARRQCRR